MRSLKLHLEQKTSWREGLKSEYWCAGPVSCRAGRWLHTIKLHFLQFKHPTLNRELNTSHVGFTSSYQPCAILFYLCPNPESLEIFRLRACLERHRAQPPFAPCNTLGFSPLFQGNFNLEHLMQGWNRHVTGQPMFVSDGITQGVTTNPSDSRFIGMEFPQ